MSELTNNLKNEIVLFKQGSGYMIIRGLSVAIDDRTYFENTIRYFYMKRVNFVYTRSLCECVSKLTNKQKIKQNYCYICGH
jgi:hypothetical protein